MTVSTGPRKLLAFLPLLTVLGLVAALASCGEIFDAKVGGVAQNANATQAAGDGNTASNSNTPVSTNANATNANATANGNSTGTTSSGCATATVKYTGTIDAIIQTNCTSCHTSLAPVMTTYANTKAAFTSTTKSALTQVDSGQMPQGSTLAAADKCAIDNWAAGGYLQ